MRTETRPQQPERLTYRVRELPALTGLSRASCYELIARGDLRSIRVGKAILVPASALQEWVNGEGR